MGIIKYKDPASRASLKRSSEAPSGAHGKVIKVSDESRGEVVRDIGMDVDEIEWQDECRAIREEYVPFVRMH